MRDKILESYSQYHEKQLKGTVSLFFNLEEK